MIGAEMSARLSSPVFIGRQPEMAILTDALARSEAGSPSVVIVGGEAGIGKSRLVAELAARARERGALVLEGGSISLGSEEGLPFAPIAEALRDLSRTLDRTEIDDLVDASTRELGRLVPELLPTTAAGGSIEAPSEWAQTRLFEGFVTLLERLGERRALVLVVEDLHWADRSTRDLLAFVARRLRGERVLVLVTYRSDELHRRHPLRPWLAEMGRLPRIELVDLERFDRDELAAQLEAIIGRPAAPLLVDAIARRSEGNPFFAEELLAADPTEQGVLPARLRDVLLGRIGSLSEAARPVLAAASVAGGAVDHDLLREVVAMDDAALAVALDEAVSAQLLAPAASGTGVASDGGYAFRHALLGEAVQDELLASEQRRLHGAYAAGLAARPTPEGAAGASHLAALAYHATAANDLPLALRASIESARASTSTFAYHEAARAYERAVALWDSVPRADRPPGEDKVELLYEAAGALMTADEPERSRDAARLAVEAVDVAREPLLAARLEERLAWAIYLTGDLAAGIRLLRESVARLDGRPPSAEKAASLVGLASFTLYAGHYHDAVPIAERAIAESQAARAPSREIEALGVLGQCLAVIGDCERGLAVLREALAMALDLGEPFSTGSIYLALASTLYDCNALEESVAVGEAASDWARDLQFPGFLSMAVEGLVPLGRLREAQRILEEIPFEGGSAHHWNQAFVGIIAVRLGRLADARALIDLRRDAAPLLADAAFAGYLAVGLIELACAEGRLEDARSLVDESLGWLADAEDVRIRSRVIRLGVHVESETAIFARARRDRAGEMAAVRIGSERLQRLQELVATYVTGPSPVFDEARGNLAFAEAETTRLLGQPDPATWEAAVSHFLAPRRAYELAWCRHRQAEALLAVRAPRGEAAAALGEARAIADEIGAVPLIEAIMGLARIARLELPSADDVGATDAVGRSDGPPVEGAAAAADPIDPFGLTAREREVLALLADGQTNRRIADALFISESTASVHVSNIIGKLGVTNRVEAAALALRAGLVS
jgi:DNA-binding CsgD family transcriptional regulator/tetratricopeptide (TPR) repeat protein